MKSITDIIPTGSIIPVCTVNDPGKAVPLAQTLQDCGINFIEITLRTEGAFAAAQNVIDECPDMYVGIGTVTEAEQLRRAKEAGAHFCVSPRHDRTSHPYGRTIKPALLAGCQHRV